MKRGLVFGKFMPIHKGHMHLIETGLANCDELTVVVCSLPTEPISGLLRYAWVRNIFPQVKVFHLNKANLPQLPEECSSEEEFYGIWREEMLQFTPSVDVIFTSEDYGDKVAEYMHCEHFLVDKARTTFDVSGTRVRDNPIEYWDMLHTFVQAYFVKRVLIIGTESTGKSTLTEKLADYFDTNYVSEYARLFIEKELNNDMSRLTIEHLKHFALCQKHLSYVTFLSNKTIFIDSDALTTAMYSQFYFNEIPSEIENCIENNWDLILFCQPDVPWVYEDSRISDESRPKLNDFLRSQLDRRGMKYVEVKGNWEERWEIAVKAVNSLLQ